MQITFVFILGIFIFTLARADVEMKKLDVRLPVHRPEEVDDRNPENVNVLLSTLLEMHHNLLGQISLLEDQLKTSLPLMEQSEIKHMVQHFTAQKDNIELSIQQIQANDGLNMQESRSLGRGREASAETKTIPSLLNIFRRNPVPTTPEQSNQNIGYSLPYQPNYAPQPQYVYPAAPVAAPSFPPSMQLPNDPNGFHQQQVYVNADQQLQQQVVQQYAPAPPAQPVQYQQQQAVPQFQQQFQPTFYSDQSPALLQEQPEQVSQEIAQQHAVMPQTVQVQQQFEQQAQLQLQQQQPQQQSIASSQPQQQYQFESVFRPSSVPVRRPQASEYDTQRYQQQSPFGQKEGVFVYYPNGIITDDKDHPTIVNRFGQAFDRFGQAIQSNFGFRQPETSPTADNGSTSLAQRSETLSTSAMEKINKWSSPGEQADKKTRLGSDDNSKEEKEITKS